MEQFFNKIVSFFESTNLVEQFGNHDIPAIISNPWFVIPALIFVGYMVYKQNWKDLIILSIIGVVWWVTGTAYMDTLIIGDELQLEKILPVVGGGAVALGAVIYLLFGRSN